MANSSASPPLETPDAAPHAVDRAAIAAAYERIRPYVRTTPILEVEGSELGLDGLSLVLKLEQLQHAGSFKSRGAFANLLGRTVPPAGVVAASGGNHGVAVSYAASRLGVKATIFLPKVASPAKIARIRGYGAELVIGGDFYADALAASEDFAKRTGAIPIHAYDQVETMQGQGSVGLELSRQAPDLDALVVAVGGGGLLGGIAAWYAGSIELVGVEPESAPTLTHALAAGRPVDAPAGGVAADSLAPRRVGALMYPIATSYVSRVVLVADDAIVEAQRLLWERLRLAVEPGGAAALAALLSRRFVPEKGRRVGVLVCGANTDAVRL
jgi:threonine dehydratase